MHHIRYPDSIKDSLEATRGYDDIKTLLKVDIEAHKKRVRSENGWMEERVPQYLFWGPPGTGKTALIRAIAKEANLPLIMMAGPDFGGNGLQGDSAGITDALFDVSYQQQGEGSPFIIFIDECDKFLGTEEKNPAAEIILTNCEKNDRGKYKDQHKGKYRPWLFLATNNPWALMPAVVSRVTSLEMPLPKDHQERAMIFLSQIVKEFGSGSDDKPPINLTFADLLKLGKLTGAKAGFSGRDISGVVAEVSKKGSNLSNGIHIEYIGDKGKGIPVETNKENSQEKITSDDIENSDSEFNKKLRDLKMTLKDVLAPIRAEAFFEQAVSKRALGSVLPRHGLKPYNEFRENNL
jgi:SpoVK/Ycf46/Vps4 family AAA+-type ATPase